MDDTRRVIAPGAAAAEGEADAAMDGVAEPEEPLDADALPARPRRHVERKQGSEPYIVRERVAVVGMSAAVGADLPPEPAPRRGRDVDRRPPSTSRPSSAPPRGRERSVAQEIGGALRGARAVRARASGGSTDLRVSVLAGGGGGGGVGGGGIGKASRGADLRSQIGKSRRLGGPATPAGRGGRSPLPAAARGGGGGSAAVPRRAPTDPSRADGKWEHDLYYQL